MPNYFWFSIMTDVTGKEHPEQPAGGPFPFDGTAEEYAWHILELRKQARVHNPPQTPAKLLVRVWQTAIIQQGREPDAEALWAASGQ
ncbi:hypothetical protein [Streptacidiphilus sp. EB129]|uniref:hypothetical protein n=1 Tax=Streptacidiphilus sp. EB129 TaxID=3156262 RepID=UPI0035156BB5